MYVPQNIYDQKGSSEIAETPPRWPLPWALRAGTEGSSLIDKPCVQLSYQGVGV